MFQNLWKFITTVAKRFLGEGYPLQAAGLSYISLLTLVPLTTVCVSILAAFPVFKGIDTMLQAFIIKNFVASSAQVVQQYLSSFVTQATKLSGPGIFFLCLAALVIIFAVERAFNRIWHIAKRRNAVQAFLMYWAVLTLTPVLLGIGVIMSSYVMSFSLISGAAAIPIVKKMFLLFSPYFLTFFAFTLLYVAVPNCKVKIRHGALGAIIATILFEIAKQGFTFYITHFPTYRLLYGTLAVIPIFLVWLYCSWLVVLFGAIISYESQNFSADKG